MGLVVFGVLIRPTVPHSSRYSEWGVVARVEKLSLRVIFARVVTSQETTPRREYTSECGTGLEHLDAQLLQMSIEEPITLVTHVFREVMANFGVMHFEVLGLLQQIIHRLSKLHTIADAFDGEVLVEPER